MRNTLAMAVLVFSVIAVAVTGTPSGTMSTSASNRARLLVVNKGDRTLSIVDPESGSQLATVPLGGTTGHEVAVSSDGQTAWVPIYGDSGVGSPGSDGRAVSVIDLNSRKMIASIDLGGPTRPHCAIMCPKDGRLYVTAELTRSIKVIDPSTRKVVDSIPTGEPQSHMLAISSDVSRGYTSNVDTGTISVIDLRKKKVLHIIRVAKTVQRIAISADDRWVFTADQTKPQIAIIDTRTNVVKTWIKLSDIGFGMTPTRDGRRLLITHPTSDAVSILDLHSMKVERVIHVPPDPQEILIRPDDQIAYVSCDESKQVVAIDLSSGTVTKLIDVGAGADGLGWAVAVQQ